MQAESTPPPMVDTDAGGIYTPPMVDTDAGGITKLLVCSFTNSFLQLIV